MKWLYKILSVLTVLAGAVLGVWFYLDNMEPVTIHLFGKSIEGVQFALWLLVFFIAGTFVGLSVSAVQSMRHRMHLQIMRKQLKAMKQKSSVR
jgi:uncharacterized integral membrane protein